jgi:hypothetical protein
VLRGALLERVGPALRRVENAQDANGVIEHRVDDKAADMRDDELTGLGRPAGAPQCLEVRQPAHLDEHCVEHTRCRRGVIRTDERYQRFKIIERYSEPDDGHT